MRLQRRDRLRRLVELVVSRSLPEQPLLSFERCLRSQPSVGVSADDHSYAQLDFLRFAHWGADIHDDSDCYRNGCSLAVWSDDGDEHVSFDGNVDWLVDGDSNIEPDNYRHEHGDSVVAPLGFGDRLVYPRQALHPRVFAYKLHVFRPVRACVHNYLLRHARGIPLRFDRRKQLSGQLLELAVDRRLDWGLGPDPPSHRPVH